MNLIRGLVNKFVSISVLVVSFLYWPSGTVHAAVVGVESQTAKTPSFTNEFGLSPDVPPGSNFDLLSWKLNTPSDHNNDDKSDHYSERDLAAGFQDERYFYTANDGGMVFKATVAGAKTSKNTKFTRTELREMLRRGNTDINTKTKTGTPNLNNWVFSSAPKDAQVEAGAVDGKLRATLAVNHVTTTGHEKQVGRVVIGQIHAKNDEPIRLYYRKLPNNKYGSIYAAHEPSNGKDTYIDLLGSRASTAKDTNEGIALNEKFSYEIDAVGNHLRVSISKQGKLLASHTFDMTASGYDVNNDYMYFKAGVCITRTTPVTRMIMFRQPFIN